ncbi:hypothetical protein [Streptomyces sp. NBC_00649]|uniref:hypothetical protein n=1 Tax=Streptomyces sp. NBC_00649 TaxID=2975798 RepID=UPI00324975DB
MDAGEVALVGAVATVLGGLVGTLGAVLGAGLQRGGELRSGIIHMQRQSRRESYTMAVQSLTAARALAEKTAKAVFSWEITDERRIELCDACQAISIADVPFADVHALVVFEGPHEVIEALNVWRHATRDAVDSARHTLSTTWNRPGNERMRAIQVTYDRLDRVKEAERAFMQAARRATYKTRQRQTF